MPYPASPAVLAGLAGLLGLIVGSFLNVVIYRLPLMLDRDWRRQCREMVAPEGPADSSADNSPPFNLLRPRSACPACGAPVRPQHNIPVLSYLLLGGRCAACAAAIPLRYPLVELLTGIVSAMVALHFGASLEGAAALALCWALIALAFIDLDHQILPDVITLPLLWLGIVVALLGEENGGYRVLTDLRGSAIGAIAGYVSLWVVFQVFRLVTGKEGMGYGDFKLLGMLGAWLGWQMLPLIILLSALVGAIVGVALIVIRGRDRQLPLPFGPYLAAAGFVALMWGRPLIDAYRGISGI